MDAKIDAKKVIKKRDRNRILKALAYVAAFPLLIALVFVGSIPFMNGAGFGATKYYGVIVCVAAWLVITVVQLLMALFTKNSTARGVVVIIFTLIVMVGGTLVFDIWAEKQLNAERDEYVKTVYGIGDEVELTYLKNQSNKDIVTFQDDEFVKAKYGDDIVFVDDEVTGSHYTVDAYGINYVTFKYKSTDKTAVSKPVSVETDFKNYSYQVNHYITWTNKGSLTGDYNGLVNEFMRVYNIGFGSGVKGGVNTDGSAYGATTQVDAEGNPEYWFGEKGNVYKENGMFADGYIFSVDVANEILITYYETQNAYAKKGLDADEALADAIAKAKASSEWRNYVKTDEYKAAYGPGGAVNSFKITEERLGEIISALGKGIVEEDLLGALPNIGGLINLGEIVQGLLDDLGLTMDDIENLTLESVMDLIEGFGLDLSMDDIMALLGGFSNYEMSNILPVMYFIEDAELREYAYAKYYGETHGANIGSVLIPSKSADGTLGNVGHITMSTSGLSASENAFSLNECYKLRSQNSYVPTLYPLFAARRYAYIFAGVISLMFAIYYYAQMKVNLLGKKLEKMSTLGGGR